MPASSLLPAALFGLLGFVLGAIGLVELLRYVQGKVAFLRRPLGRAILFGIAGGLLPLTLLRPLSQALPAEVVLLLPLLTAVAGIEGDLIGLAALILLAPWSTPLLLATGAVAGVLSYLHRSPLWALIVGVAMLPMLGLAGTADLNLWLVPLGGALLVAYLKVVDGRRQDLLVAEQRAAQDGLTGVLNRTGFEQWLSRHRESQGSLLMIDLDDFKSVNEVYGHATGDAVLRDAATRLATSLRPGDALGRLGGDEFVAAVAGAGKERAVQIARRMLDALGGTSMEGDDRALNLSASIGVAEGSLGDILPRADAALLRAKADGKARICADGEPESHSDEENQLLRITSFARELLYGMPVGIVVTGRSRRLVSASPEFERLTSLTERTLRGRNPCEAIGGKIADPQILEQLERDGHWQGQVVSRRPDESMWWADWILRAVQVRGRTFGYFGICRDATEDQRRYARLLTGAVAMLSEYLEPTIGSHLARVGRYMELMVRAFQQRYGRSGVPYNPEDYGMAAMLHDVGKFEIPMAVLRKPGPLSEDERRLLQRHPAAGYEYLGRLWASLCQGPSSSYLQALFGIAMEIARGHHERCDGTGYPEGAEEAQIPLSVRIFAVADVYDSLRSARVYRAAWSHAQALEHVVNNAGKLFDASVVGLLPQLAQGDSWKAIARLFPSDPFASDAGTVPRAPGANA